MVETTIKKTTIQNLQAKVRHLKAYISYISGRLFEDETYKELKKKYGVKKGEFSIFCEASRVITDLEYLESNNKSILYKLFLELKHYYYILLFAIILFLLLLQELKNQEGK